MEPQWHVARGGDDRGASAGTAKDTLGKHAHGWLACGGHAACTPPCLALQLPFCLPLHIEQHTVFVVSAATGMSQPGLSLPRTTHFTSLTAQRVVPSLAVPCSTSASSTST